jgi:hypothetical protein
MLALRDITHQGSAARAPATIPDTTLDIGQARDTGHALSGFLGRVRATAISSVGPPIAVTPSLAKTISMAAIAITRTSMIIAWVRAGVAASGGRPYPLGLISASKRLLTVSGLGLKIGLSGNGLD